MLRWAVPIVALLVLVGILLWKVARPAPGPAVASHEATAPAQAGRAGGPGLAPHAEPGLDAGPGAPAMLDPHSEAYSKRLDIGIPARLRASLAHCYPGGRDPDLSLHIRYHLRVRHGDARALDVAVTRSELGDRALEDCMVQSIRELTWREEDLPDLDEDDDLFVRLLTLVKYKSEEDQARQKEVDHLAALRDGGPS
jgi:hypothetical protein